MSISIIFPSTTVTATNIIKQFTYTSQGAESKLLHLNQAKSINERSPPFSNDNNKNQMNWVWSQFFEVPVKLSGSFKKVDFFWWCGLFSSGKLFLARVYVIKRSDL